MGRAIPASRSGLREALEIMQVSSTGLLLLKCFGLSLSDQYWVNSYDKPLDWDGINFFENEFSEDVGNALFGREAKGDINLVSPDNTSDGWLKKKWIIADGKRMLVKGGSGPYYQEPLNEVLATTLCERLGIPHAAYTAIDDGGRPVSLCEDFIDAGTELVSAWDIFRTMEKPNSDSNFVHYLNCCERLGIPGVRDGLGRMLAIDYIMANTDRHFNNFGAVRDAVTLEWLCPAPVFDTGTSMWHNEVASMIRANADADSKPFLSKHSKQIELVTNFSWLDMHALSGIEDACTDIYAQSDRIDNERINTLCAMLKRRIKALNNIATSKRG
jgi:hypothetical protein